MYLLEIATHDDLTLHLEKHNQFNMGESFQDYSRIQDFEADFP